MFTKKWLLSILTMGVVLGIPLLAFSGTGYELICENKNCNYKGNVRFGGGKAFEQITGYCVSGGKFVYLTWKRGTKKPDPIGNIWDHHTGKIFLLYKSPGCSEPIIAMDSVGELKYCPKCTQPTLKSKVKVMFD